MHTETNTDTGIRTRSSTLARGAAILTDKKRIMFYVEPKDYEIIEQNAKGKGLKVSDFARMALFSFINKYSSKSVFTSKQ